MADLIIAVLLGTAIGISLGALGGGGSLLTVPGLVYALHVNAHHATTASLVIVGLSALIGTAGHARAGRVRWPVGLTLGIVSIPGSLLGTWLNHLLDPNVLLLVFAALMFVVAVLMIKRQHGGGPVPRRRPPTARFVDEDDAGGGGAAVRTPSRVEAPAASRLRARPVVVVGLGVGFLTGFLGVGGGFVIVPALVLALGFTLADAVGTSLLIIAVSSGFALLERGGVHGVAPHILWPFAAAAMAASLVGNLVASRAPADKLNRGFIGLVIVVAFYVTIRSVLALS